MDKIIGFLNEFEDWEQRLYVDYAIKQNGIIKLDFFIKIWYN